MFRRIGIFLLLNFTVVVTVSVILNLLNVAPYLTSKGIDYTTLAIFCFVWGMAGSLISLLMSKQIAKWMMGIKIIKSDSANPAHLSILKMVESLARQANLPEVPEVGIFNSKEPNAFATGPTKSSSLIGVSSGLLENLTKEEVEAVLAHEISHIENGDMITMTLIQGLVNSFVLFFARVLALALSGFSRDGKGGRSMGSFFLLTIIFEVMFMVLGSIIVAYFSRRREYKADWGAKEMLGRDPMINALRKLDSYKHLLTKSRKEVATLMIHSHPRGFLTLFHTHPSIEDRIAHLNSDVY